MTTRRPEKPGDDGDEDNLQQAAGSQDQPSLSSREPGSFVQRIGLTGLLAATAALVTVVVALINTFDSRHGHAPDAAPANAAANAPFTISDYWYGIPANSSQPLIFHLMVNEPVTGPEGRPPGTPPNPQAPADATDAALSIVHGTVRNPCQDDSLMEIDSGTWNGSHLIVYVNATSVRKPITLDVFREAQQLNGTLTQASTDGAITLRRGETGCPR